MSDDKSSLLHRPMMVVQIEVAGSDSTVRQSLVIVADSSDVHLVDPVVVEA